ncbi:MAG: TlpA family protein disulfide reductase [Desulfobacterota bacterium]|nr:TlpA family protein disulfide reductase [Thermodesulfobacteriota bacterium]
MNYNKKRRKWGWLVVILLIFGSYSGKVWGGSGDLGSLQDITIIDLNGNTFKFSDHRGKVIVLNFWAIWCPPCQIETPHLISLYDRYRKEGLMVLGVAIASGGDEKIKNKVREWKIPYPVINGDNFPSIQQNFREIRAVPTSYIIDSQGRFYKHYIGFSKDTMTELEKDIQTLLSQNKKGKCEQ